MISLRRSLFHMACIGLAVASTASVSAIASSAEAQHNTQLRPGLWEIRTATRMQGMPSELPPVPYTANQCITQEQLDNLESLSAVSGTQGNCDIHDAEVTPTRTEWTMTCHKDAMQVEAKGVITPISREVYTGNVHFTMHGRSMPRMNGTVNVQGQWQGECNAASGGQMQPSFRTPSYLPDS